MNAKHNVKHLDHLNLTVRSFEETADWYRRVFGFETVEDKVDADGVRWGVLRAGEALLCIYEHGEFEFGPRDGSGRHRLNHFGLRITDREGWEATLAREKLELNWGGETRWPHSTAWYVSDPTGYEIEVALWDHDTVAFG